MHGRRPIEVVNCESRLRLIRHIAQQFSHDEHISEMRNAYSENAEGGRAIGQPCTAVTDTVYLVSVEFPSLASD